MTGGRFEPVSLLVVEMELAGQMRPVGRLAKTDRGALFQYDAAFPRSTHDISPLRLKEPPGSRAIEASATPFDGLHGVFDDSLPDGWGRLLMDRKLLEIGIHPRTVSNLDRLAWIGSRGMGALRYRPEHRGLVEDSKGGVDLDSLAAASRAVLAGSAEVVIDELLRVGGSPGGARPKALIGKSSEGQLIHGADDLPDGFSHWLVKFRAKEDLIDAGAIEYAYALMASAAGIDVPEVVLLPSADSPGHFAIRRFDRQGPRRIHMHTAAGLLNASHRWPSLTYEDLLRATMALTRDQRQVNQMFMRMVFNVLAWNRDDHTKNHAFLMAGDGTWTVSPAYDLTFNPGAGGEHALTIAGEGARPTEEHLRRAARSAGVRPEIVADSLEQTKSAIARWPEFAKAAGASREGAAAIGKTLRVS